MDAASADGSAEWLQTQSGLTFVSEKDKGMYDAVNKGFQRASGDILCYLNCDEQYLPGALNCVNRYFETHPQTDILFGDMLLIRPDGSLIAFRKSYPPRSAYIKASFLYVPSCAMFLRRKVLESGIMFNTRYTANSDADYVARLLDGGFKAAYIREYLAAFTLTGKNMSAGAVAGKESEHQLASAPEWIRKGKPLLNLLRLTEKFLSGAYFQKKPLRYSILVMTDNGVIQQKNFSIHNPDYKWQWS